MNAVSPFASSFASESLLPAGKPPQSPSQKFEQEQAQVFSKIVTILSQNPNSPMDPQKIFEFHNSMTQMIQSKKQTIALEALEKNAQLSQFLQSGSLVGKTIASQGDSFFFQKEVALPYLISSQSQKTLVDILDSQGRVLETIKGETAPGEHTVRWTPSKENRGCSYQVRVTEKAAQGVQEKKLGVFSLPKACSQEELCYKMPETVEEAFLEIYTDQGHLVATHSANPAAGHHSLSLQSLQNTLGPGRYRFCVRGANNEGQPVVAQTSIKGLVERVEMQNNLPVLKKGDLFVPLTDLCSIYK